MKTDGGLIVLLLLSVSCHLVVGERMRPTSNPLDRVTRRAYNGITLPEPICGQTTFLKTQCYPVCPTGHLIVSGLNGCGRGTHCCTS